MSDPKLPFGAIELEFEHLESGNGQEDDYEIITLAGDGSKLTMIVEVRECSTVDGQRKTVSRYQISPQALINFIRANGTISS